eukprot:g2794.t1
MLKAKGLSRLAKEVLISPCRRPFQIGSLVRCLATNGEWRVMIVDKVTQVKTSQNLRFLTLVLPIFDLALFRMAQQSFKRNATFLSGSSPVNRIKIKRHRHKSLTFLLWKDIIPPLSSPCPLKEILPKRFPSIFASETAVKKCCRRGEISVGSEEVVKGHLLVKGGELIQWHVREKASSDAVKNSTLAIPKFERDRVKVLYENEDFAAVLKPDDMPTNSRGVKRNLSSIIPSILKPSTMPQCLAKPKVVHRLDAATGGIVLCAKTRSYDQYLKMCFSKRKVSKRYEAIVFGNFPKRNDDLQLLKKERIRRTAIRRFGRSEKEKIEKFEQQCIKEGEWEETEPFRWLSEAEGMAAAVEALLGTNSSLSTSIIPFSFCVDSNVFGRTGVTYGRILWRSEEKEDQVNLTHLELYPKTGRKHQLRVHLSKVLCTPILGDKKYGYSFECDESLTEYKNSLYLWATRIEFPKRTENGKSETTNNEKSEKDTIVIQTKLPEKFGRLLNLKQ